MSIGRAIALTVNVALLLVRSAIGMASIIGDRRRDCHARKRAGQS
jgi:hypothetical protein